MSNRYDIIVIGAGAGGLVVAIGGAAAKKKVLLIEKGLFGGNCTNFGCIPSKSLIASAHHVHSLKVAKEYGIETSPFSFDASGALKRVRKIVEEIRSHEDPAALKKLGVETLEGTASFKDPHTLTVNGKEIQGKQIAIATGSYPVIPPIEGRRNEVAPLLVETPVAPTF